MTTSQGRIPLPRAPQAPQAHPFPVLAFVAPIIAAAMMWAFTRSPFVLVFAVLGPVVALATMGDSRRRARADLRQQGVTFDRDFAIALRDIEEAHQLERAELKSAAPCSAALIVSAVRDSERWRGVAGEQLIVRLGVGRITSRVVLDEDAAAVRDSRTPHSGKRRVKKEPLRSLDELRERAGSLDNAPVVVDARLGIGLYGARAEVTAVATSIAVQLASMLSPMDVDLAEAIDVAEVFQWTKGLPHSSSGSRADHSLQGNFGEPGGMTQLIIRPRSGGTPVILCVADDEQSLPRDCRVVITVVGSRARLVRHPENHFPEPFVPDYVSHRQATRFAETLQHAARLSFAHMGHALPDRVTLRELMGKGATAGESPARDTSIMQRLNRDSLAATIGIGAAGPISIDLVLEGPHAVVGGTTGSGKSEVLVTWVLALAAAYCPADVNFLLVDFKGGAAFAPVQGLPHTVGVLTDLDPAGARRAILSLQAELRRREQILADAEVRSIAELPLEVELPRLLIVVDEFAAMASSFTEMHDLFADLAARGRSLGIHLILCTQRPAGSIRDAILANCALRVSLRVNNSADSVAVLGTSDAARVPKHLPGRGFLLRGGSEVEPVQWAVTGEADAAEITAFSLGKSTPIRRPWLDPLPDILDSTAVPAVPRPGIAFGLVDVPEKQQQTPAVYDPEHGGNLFVIGCHRSGKSTTLATFAKLTRNVIIVPSDVEGAWDAVTDVLTAVRAGAKPCFMMLDDLDLLVGKFSPEHESAFIERLMALAREGPQTGTTMVVTASAMRGRVQTVASLCASTLVLRMRDRQDHVLVGGESSDFSAQLPPGGGFWNGQRTQVCFSEPLPSRVVALALPLELASGGTIGVVSARPATIRSRLEKLGQIITLDAWRTRQGEDHPLGVDRGSEPIVIVGDPDAWLSSPTILGALRARSAIVFHDCSPTEFRSLARIRELPPPLNSPHDTVVVLQPDGQLHRATLEK